MPNENVPPSDCCQVVYIFIYVFFCFRICTRTKTFPFFQLTCDRFRGGTIYSLPLFSHGQARFPDMATCTRTVWKGQLFCCEIGFFLDDIKKNKGMCLQAAFVLSCFLAFVSGLDSEISLCSLLASLLANQQPTCCLTV